MNRPIYPEIAVLQRARVALASASPRRRELLARLLGEKDFQVVAANIDEAVLPAETPATYVHRLALEKAEAGYRIWMSELEPEAQGLVIGADTSVVLNGRIFGKPENAAGARLMLAELSGKTHEVVTGVAVLLVKNGQVEHQESMTVSTEVEFQALSRAELEWYVETGEPLDKAGAYAIQGFGGTLIRAVRGDYYNVVGLPLVPLIGLLRKLL